MIKDITINKVDTELLEQQRRTLNFVCYNGDLLTKLSNEQVKHLMGLTGQIKITVERVKGNGYRKKDYN